MTFRVLIVGATGAFGRRLAERLAATLACDLVLASRTMAKLDGLIARLKSLYPDRKIEGAVLDKDTVSPDRLRALALNVVVDAAGPFQDAEPSLARAAIAAGAHYVDLADARAFVADFTKLDADAKAAGVLAVTGASSTPAVSNAVVDRLTQDWQRVDDIAIAISPGNRAQPGISVVEAILSYAGKPVRVWLNGAWQTRPGWGELICEDMPNIGKRWLSLCDTPDLDQLPARFPTARSAIFRAGVELGIFHLGLWLLSMAVRLQLIPSLKPFARLFHGIFEAFSGFGHERGGMTVKVSGLDARGRTARARWSLSADGDGPNVPIIPALALIRSLSREPRPEPGAKVCAGILDLAALEYELAPLKIRTRTDVLPGADAPIYAQVMGAAFETIPSLVRHVHSPAPKSDLEGGVDIEGAETAVGQLIARIVGFPETAKALPARVSIERIGDEEVWTRRFGAASFSSRVGIDSSGTLYERFGPITMPLDIRPTARGFALAVKGWRFGPIPLPRFLMPSTRAGGAMDDQGRYTFDVSIRMPLVGRLVHYRGWLMEAAAPNATPAAMTNNLAAAPLAKSAAHS